MLDSFFTTRVFFDNKYYPRGFARYGHFTIREAKLLERFGCAYHDLYIGNRRPKTDEEKRFVKVCCGEYLALTMHEKVWMKYIYNIKNPKKIHTLMGVGQDSDNLEDQIDIDEQLISKN